MWLKDGVVQPNKGERGGLGGWESGARGFAKGASGACRLCEEVSVGA